MAQTQTDIDAGRQLLLDTVDTLMKERGAVDISMTELASLAGMSSSNIQRFFESKEELLQAVAERWFADKVQIMEDVVASDMPIREKMNAFFGRRFVVMNKRIEADPELFHSYCELGRQYFEVVRGYVDLGDHYLAMIIAEAMDEGYFEGLSIDQSVSLINQMISPYCLPDIVLQMRAHLSEEKLAIIIDTIFAGLRADGRKSDQPDMHLVS